MSIFEHIARGADCVRVWEDSPATTGNVLDLTLAVGRGVVFAHQIDTPAEITQIQTFQTSFEFS